jgi:hypothetical protein
MTRDEMAAVLKAVTEAAGGEPPSFVFFETAEDLAACAAETPEEYAEYLAYLKSLKPEDAS